MAGPKKPTAPETKDEKNDTAAFMNKKKCAVVQAVVYLEKEARNACSMIPKPLMDGHFSVAEDQAESHLLDIIAELKPVIRNKLFFSARLEYIYASQMAKHSTRTSTSGESLGRIENRLKEAMNYREECLGARDNIIATLKEQLHQLRYAGSQTVKTCRTESKADYEDVRILSKDNLENLQSSLEENRLTMRSHELRDEEEELELRKKRQDLEEEIMRKIRHYDATMSSLQTTLDALREEDKSVTVLLQKKKVEFDVMEQRFEEIEAEKRRIEEARMAAKQAEFRREYAARTIQRAWQHYKMRKMLKKAQRKKKKKPKDK